MLLLLLRIGKRRYVRTRWLLLLLLLLLLLQLLLQQVVKLDYEF